MTVLEWIAGKALLDKIGVAQHQINPALGPCGIPAHKAHRAFGPDPGMAVCARRLAIAFEQAQRIAVKSQPERLGLDRHARIYRQSAELAAGMEGFGTIRT